MTPDEQIAQIATSQHGLVTVSQARAVGLSEKAVRHRLAQGRWQRVRKRVYALTGTPESWERSVLAAVLAAGSGVLASHMTAARLWQLPVPTDGQIEIVTPIERQLRLDGVLVHRSGLWHEFDIAEVDGIPTTSAARTAIDLSNRLDDSGFERCIDEALRLGVLSLSALARFAHRFDIAHGRSPKRVQRSLAARIPGMHLSESALESRVMRVISTAQLPRPTPQFEVSADGRRFRVDLAYPEHRVVIEIDGFDFHRSRTAFDHDRDRQNLLVLAGYRVLRFTSRSTDEDVVRSITAALFVR